MYLKTRPAAFPIYDSINLRDVCEACGKVLYQYEVDPLAVPTEGDGKLSARVKKLLEEGFDDK